MRIAGIILVILGLVGLAYGGLTYTRHRDTVNIGPLTATVSERESLPISPVAGVIAVIAGVGLIMGAGRRRA